MNFAFYAKQYLVSQDGKIYFKDNTATAIEPDSNGMVSINGSDISLPAIVYGSFFDGDLPANYFLYHLNNYEFNFLDKDSHNYAFRNLHLVKFERKAELNNKIKGEKVMNKSKSITLKQFMGAFSKEAVAENACTTFAYVSPITKKKSIIKSIVNMKNKSNQLIMPTEIRNQCPDVPYFISVSVLSYLITHINEMDSDGVKLFITDRHAFRVYHIDGNWLNNADDNLTLCKPTELDCKVTSKRVYLQDKPQTISSTTETDQIEHEYYSVPIKYMVKDPDVVFYYRGYKAHFFAGGHKIQIMDANLFEGVEYEITVTPNENEIVKVQK